MKNQKLDFYFLALAATGEGISGSDRIFIEFARRWSKVHSIGIVVTKEGREMCRRQSLEGKDIKYRISNVNLKYGFLINYFLRIFEGIKFGFGLKLKNPQNIIIYSASEFWMDSIPGFILKLRFPKVRWVASWFQTAPNPIIGFSEGSRENKYYLRAFVYWCMQLPIKPIIAKFADYVLVNNDRELKQFPSLYRKNKVKVVFGAVNIEGIEEWRVRNKKNVKIYDAVFQGRFHPQKGVLELIAIWRIVVNQKKDAKLVMIGDGPLMKDVKEKIKKLNLEDNIILKGYLFDGEEKYKIFSQSKLVVHPAFFDSGGMASAEAMVFGIPVVGFDLESYKSYYPKGMVKVEIGNIEVFANTIIDLLDNHIMRNRVGVEALKMIKKDWSWDKRAVEILETISTA